MEPDLRALFGGPLTWRGLPRRAARRALTLVGAAILLAAAPCANAAGARVERPSNHSPPEVGGTLREREVLLAFPGMWKGGLPMQFSSRWERCDADRCSSTGQAGFVMRLGAADVGKRMRAAVTASNEAGSVVSLSRQSGIVRPRLQEMRPFPVVALRGYITRSGIFVSRLAARAPIGSRLQLTCRGRGCPYRSRAATFQRGFVAVRKMHGRTLGVGTQIALRITQGQDRIGKYTRFRVRKGRRPARVDRCLNPDRRAPISCPRRQYSAP